MNRDAFEQLVSQSLDEPGRDDLRARIDAATSDNPERAALLDEWQRFDAELTARLRVPPTIDWNRFQTRVSNTLDSAANADDKSEAALDNALRATPTLDEHVDWNAFRRRVSAHLDAHSTTTAARTLRPRILAAAVAALATAAALLIAILHPSTPPVPISTGVASVKISAPASLSNAGVAIVRLVHADASLGEPEAFFVIDPATNAAPAEELPGLYY